jgi:multidrug efflux pump
MSMIVALAGLVSITRLQDRELPDVDPPAIYISTEFPGAAARVVETAITDLIEDEVLGIPGVKHVISGSQDGWSFIELEFALDVDIDEAANDTRDRVARMRALLPKRAREPAIAKSRSDAAPIMYLALTSERGDLVELTRLAESRIVDRISRLPGIAQVHLVGERRHAIRIWIDTRALASYGLSIVDLEAALERENVNAPSGRIESTSREFMVRSSTLLRSASEFERLVVGSVAGAPVTLSDVARIEAGSETARTIVRVNGTPAIGLGVVKQSKANSLAVAETIRDEIDRISRDLPSAVRLYPTYDSSTFVRQSIDDVTRTIFEAVALVVLVIFAFLRSVRATLIPALAIVVSCLGTFAVLYAAGFTINTLTLMGVTLAIGLVVDDAIVVVENISRWLESGSPVLEAARRGMQEISFAVIAATLSTMAAFAPLILLSDMTGRLFREFALTVAAAVAVSGFVALTLSPALCARQLRRQQGEAGIQGALARVVEGARDRYGDALAWVLRRPHAVVAAGVLWFGLGFLVYDGLDQELIPSTDRGQVHIESMSPWGTSLASMDELQRSAEQIVLDTAEVDDAFSIVSGRYGSPNFSMIYASLLDPNQRSRSQQEVTSDLGERLGTIAGLQAWAYGPSALPGRGGSKVNLFIVGPDLYELAELGEELKRRAEALPEGYDDPWVYLNLDQPQLSVEIDRERASDLGVSMQEITDTLDALLAGRTLSRFDLAGETHSVIAQLEWSERNDPKDIEGIFVRSASGDLIALSAMLSVREATAPTSIDHHDGQRSVRFTVDPDPERVSQGAAIETVMALAREVLPADGEYQLRLTGEAERFMEARGTLGLAYLLSILIVYLVLAAQFESFVHPLTILIAVALSFTGGLVALLLSGSTLNIFSWIGLVALIGLASKNSILIVEFANQLRGRGYPLIEAALEGAKVRFRPILMTALSTMVGILPIALGQGAGGDSRAPLGIVIVGGMFFATALTLLIVPAAYVLVGGLQGRLQRIADAAAPASAAAIDAGTQEVR